MVRISERGEAEKIAIFFVQQPPKNFLGFGVSLEKFNRNWVQKKGRCANEVTAR